ncbi:hypothetical protein [Desulfoferrobacter suflitae]|uniref:hypothetical protein n=1 Tax=Desulfoferrobacter suflitae TaxID=2865782 RepID=UPI0021641B23|nr:hypothetical protein [Desulfoferrobacter suflitae]MCK8603595.1 hypothetical protein [Desulfoferrobacter suflitae]
MQPDKLTAASRIVRAIVILFVLAAAGILLASFAGSPQQRIRLFARSLNLTSPAFIAAGHALRHPEFLHPAVDLCFSPLLGNPPPDPHALLFEPRAPLVSEGLR